MTVADQLLEISKSNPIRPSQLIRAKFVPPGLHIEIVNLPADTAPTYRFYHMEPTDDIIGEMTARRTIDDLKCCVAPQVLCRAIDVNAGKVLTSREINRFRPDGGYSNLYVAVIFNIDDGDEVIWMKDLRPTQIDQAGLRAAVLTRLNRRLDDFDYLCCQELAILGEIMQGEVHGSKGGSSDGVQTHRE